MRAQPRRHPAGVPDGLEGAQLGLAVEPVAGLSLERRRAVLEHPASVTLDPRPHARRVERTSRTDRAQDPATGGMELLVARSASAQRILLDPITAEARVRVTVDQARHRTPPATVDLDRLLAANALEISHAPHRGNATTLAEDVRVLDHLDLPEGRSTQGSGVSLRRGELGEIPDEEAGSAVALQLRRGHHQAFGKPRPCRCAATTASS